MKLCLTDMIHNLSEWYLFWFDKTGVNYFEILLIDVSFYL